MKNTILLLLILSNCSPESCFKQGTFYHPPKQNYARIRAIIQHEKVVITQRVVLDTIKIVKRVTVFDTVYITKLIPAHESFAWRDSLHWLDYRGANIPKLKAQADVIRFETQPGANTKMRIADMFADIIRELEILKGATIKLQIIKTDPLTLKPLNRTAGL